LMLMLAIVGIFVGSSESYDYEPVSCPSQIRLPHECCMLHGEAAENAGMKNSALSVTSGQGNFT